MRAQRLGVLVLLVTEVDGRVVAAADPATAFGVVAAVARDAPWAAQFIRCQLTQRDALLEGERDG